MMNNTMIKYSDTWDSVFYGRAVVKNLQRTSYGGGRIFPKEGLIA